MVRQFEGVTMIEEKEPSRHWISLSNLHDDNQQRFTNKCWSQLSLRSLRRPHPDPPILASINRQKHISTFNLAYQIIAPRPREIP